MTSTALYVLVTRVYPQRLHTAILAGFSAAWVVPSIAGPVRGRAHHADDRLALGLRPGPRRPRGRRRAPRAHPRRAAAGGRRRAVAHALASPRRSPSPSPCSRSTAAADRLDPLGVTLGVLALVVVALTLLPLTPRGTLRAARGLPTDIALRALAFAAFSGAEVYLPRLLTERDGLSPSLAGVALTITGVTWFVGSWVQGRWDRRFEIGRTAAVSLGAITLSLLGLAAAVALDAPTWVVIAALSRGRPRDRHALPAGHGPGPRPVRGGRAGLRQLGPADRRLLGCCHRHRRLGHRLRRRRLRRPWCVCRGLRRHGRARPHRLGRRPPGPLRGAMDRACDLGRRSTGGGVVRPVRDLGPCRRGGENVSSQSRPTPRAPPDRGAT